MYFDIKNYLKNNRYHTTKYDFYLHAVRCGLLSRKNQIYEPKQGSLLDAWLAETQRAFY